MFYGEYHHQLDDKGRFRIPPRFRDGLGKDAMMILGIEKCLLLYTGEDFNERVLKRFKDADFLDIKTGDLKRVIFPSAQPIVEDKQGRVTLSQNLMDRTGITKNVISIGVMDRVEIWDEETYVNHMNDLDFKKILGSFTE